MDRCRTLCLLSLMAAGCGEEPSSDTGEVREGFYVVSSTPEQGATNVGDQENPQFLLSEAADPGTCGEEPFVMVATDESGEFAFDVDFSVSLSEDGLTLSFVHQEPFLPGFWYVAMVTSSAAPCTDMTGNALAPYGVEFYVP